MKKVKIISFLNHLLIVNRNHFDFLYIIGRGGFGRIWKVVEKRTRKTFALKEMKKVKVIDKKSEISILYEREFLSRLHHPFIVNMTYSFQDFEYLYLVIDLLTGGDLRYHICKYRRFTEKQTKFFIACIILALEYIRSKNVIHRDIKPENLVLDDKGFLRLTDFGIAKIYSPNRDNSHETSGTPGYMAPEVMRGLQHSYTCDYFAVGVLGYEFLIGRRPYLGKNRKEIKEGIMSKQVQITASDCKAKGFSLEAADFINKLLLRKSENRLGCKGIHELKEHKWFTGNGMFPVFNWKDLFNKKIAPPFVPETKDNFDKKYCEAIEKIGLDTKDRYNKYMSNDKFKQLFINFTYYNINPDEDNNRALYSDNSSKSIKVKTDLVKRDSFSVVGYGSTIDNEMIANNLKNKKHLQSANTLVSLSQTKRTGTSFHHYPKNLSVNVRGNSSYVPRHSRNRQNSRDKICRSLSGFGKDESNSSKLHFMSGGFANKGSLSSYTKTIDERSKLSKSSSKNALHIKTFHKTPKKPSYPPNSLTMSSPVSSNMASASHKNKTRNMALSPGGSLGFKIKVGNINLDSPIGNRSKPKMKTLYKEEGLLRCKSNYLLSGSKVKKELVPSGKRTNIYFNQLMQQNEKRTVGHIIKMKRNTNSTHSTGSSSSIVAIQK